VQDKAIGDHLEKQLDRKDGREEVVKVVQKLQAKPFRRSE